MGFGTTLAEARTLVTYVSLTGVVYSSGQRYARAAGREAQAVEDDVAHHAHPSYRPVQPWNRHAAMGPFKHTTPDYYIHNYPEILDLKVNAKSGVYDVVGLTNWRSGTATRELSFADKLGLDRRLPLHCLRFLGPEAAGGFQGPDEGGD